MSLLNSPARLLYVEVPEPVKKVAPPIPSKITALLPCTLSFDRPATVQPRAMGDFRSLTMSYLLLIVRDSGVVGEVYLALMINEIGYTPELYAPTSHCADRRTIFTTSTAAE